MGLKAEDYFDWNDTRVAKLKGHFAAGWSAAQIADDLGEGCTRNMVQGKATRLGLKHDGQRFNQHTRNGRPRLPARSRTQNLALKMSGNDPGLKAPSISDLDIPPEQRKSILDLTNTTCRFPVGDVGDPGFFFCGAEGADLTDHRPYCPSHSARARTAVIGPTRKHWRGGY